MKRPAYSHPSAFINPIVSSILSPIASPIIGLGAVVLTVSLASTQAQAIEFRDVPANYWASDYIEALAEQGVIAGFPDGTFRPEAPVTRAQFAAILRQTFATLDSFSRQPFTDVPTNHWAAEAIGATRMAGFLSGYPGNRFAPEQKIPRVQTWVALASGLSYEANNSTILSYFQDGSSLPDYARAKTAAAIHAGLVVNYPTLSALNPNRNATRAEVAASIYQALVSEGQAHPLPDSPYVVQAATGIWQQTPTATLPVQAERIGLSRDGSRLIALEVEGGALTVWDTQTEDLIIRMHSNETTRLEAVAINPDGTQVAAIAQNKPDHVLSLLIWTLGSETPFVRQSLGAVRLPDSNAPDLNAPEEANTDFAPVSPQVAFGADGRTLITQVNLGTESPTSPGENLLRLHTVATGEVLHTLEPTAGAQLVQFSFSPDGALLAARGNIVPATNRPVGSVINVWNIRQGERVTTLRPQSAEFSFLSLAFTPTGILRTLERGNFYDERMSLWQVPAGVRIDQMLDVPEVDRQDFTHALSPDGIDYFMRGDVGGTRLLNTHTQEVTEFNSLVRVVVFSQNGEHLAIASPDNIKVFSKR